MQVISNPYITFYYLIDLITKIGFSSNLTCGMLGRQLDHSNSLAFGKARKAAWKFYQFGQC